jgi:Raf kinase inhibitor-like YbhB/YbcL family protein
MNKQGFFGLIGKIITIVIILLIIGGVIYFFNLKEKYFGDGEDNDITGEVIEDILEKTGEIGAEKLSDLLEKEGNDYKDFTLGGNMELTSPVFENGGEIPSKYTCEGENINPPLAISEVPEGTKSLALIMFDPDVPQEIKEQKDIEGWDHWQVWNIPATTTEISENSNPGTEGKQTGGNMGYTGPCPPKDMEPSKHRYEFTLFALDVDTLGLAEGSSRNEVLGAIDGHVLEKTELTGSYEKAA